MGKGLLFKWEDSQALSKSVSDCPLSATMELLPGVCLSQVTPLPSAANILIEHHCGFCKRPLNHPGSRNSCFGVHSEPCIRFHQAMFMRLRGHTCAYCISIDEAHYKRHSDIVQQLRSVYESCGESSWAVLPSEHEERGRTRTIEGQLADPKKIGSKDMPVDTSESKREKKDAKSLARASSRARVVTQEEIRYIDSVLHLADGLSSSEYDGPKNPEQIEEIESNLRYNAHVYNTQSNRQGLKHFAQIPDADIDFDAEMQRILEVFRISELIKRNNKHTGLQGRELRVFQGLVDGLNKAIIDDIVLVRKDLLEIRMRRAGFLRYTNKTAYCIVEERYSDKDWRTGEKLTSSCSDSSGIRTPQEEFAGSTSIQPDSFCSTPPAHTHVPDRRHLENAHKRVSGDDALATAIIDPDHGPPLPLLPHPTPEKTSTVKILSIKATETDSVKIRGSVKTKYTTGQGIDGWQTVLRGRPTSSIVKPSWAHSSSTRVSRPFQADFMSRTKDVPDMSPSRSILSTHQLSKSSTAPAVQTPIVAAVTAPSGPERFLPDKEASVSESADEHQAVSQKKRAAKKAREAKRKTKRLTAQLQPVHTTKNSQESPMAAEKPDPITLSTATTTSTELNDRDSASLQANTIKQAQLTQMGNDNNDACFDETETRAELTLDPCLIPEPPTMQVTKHTKHMHWLNFTRNFMVDQLTNPLLSTWTGCSHGTSCAFEGTDVQDCPFHKPHCPCVDPLLDVCCLVYPSPDLCSAGPYNRLHGERLLAMFEKDTRTKGRVMLADDDMVYYLLGSPNSLDHGLDLGVMPKRLAAEYADYDAGFVRGPLMEQERLFDRLWHRNKAMQQQVSRRMLQDIHRGFEGAGEVMCFCHDSIPEGGLRDKDVILCSYADCELVYFHKSCAKKLGFDMVSRWYCTTCEHKIGAIARQLLRNMGYNDVPSEDSMDPAFDAHKIQDIIDTPEGMMQKFREYMKHTRGKVEGVSVPALNID